MRQISRTISGARPSVASSRISDVGIGHQRAADREHLLLAAGELLAAVAEALARGAGTSRARARASTCGTAVGAAARRDQQVLAHRQVRKDAAALGHVADAESRDRGAARARVQSRPAHADRCRATRARARAACGSAWSCPCRCGRAGRPTRRGAIASDTPRSTWLCAVVRVRRRAPRPAASARRVHALACASCDGFAEIGAPARRRWRARRPACRSRCTRAVDHHGDAVGDAEHGVHVVLDQQDRVAGACSAASSAEHALGLLGAHAGERLVEQQHLRRRSRGTSRSRAGASGRATASPATRSATPRSPACSSAALARVAAVASQRVGARPAAPADAGAAPARRAGSSRAP